MMNGFEFPVGYLWLIIGGLLLALEAFGAPGIGLLFGGLAAVMVGMLMQAGIVGAEDIVLQIGVWFGFTVVIALLLWKPLKRWRSPKSDTKEFHNIIGDTAVVFAAELVRGSTGQARWSGTIMQAEIDPVADATRIEEGTIVEITQVRGNTLYVRPRDSRRPEEVI
jgi:membrane protein implicated in regulation of membrane protease activity